MRAASARPNWRPLAIAVAWLIGWAVAINLALLALANAGALAWLPDRQTGTGFVLDNKQRVEAAVAEYRAGRVPAGDYLVAVTGISNVREGLNVDVMRQHLGPGVRVLGVAGAGAGASSIVENASTIPDSGIRPDLVVLGIAPLQMLDTFADPAASAQVPAAEPSLRDRVRGWATEGVWLFARRNDVSISVEHALLTMRAVMFKNLGVELETPDVRSPWRPMMRAMGAERYPDKVLRRGLEWAGGIGAYDLAAYERSSRAPAMVGGLIQRLRAGGSEVIVVVTPEHSWLRDREPSAVFDLISNKLRAEANAPDLRILDFRSAIPNDGFVDLSHLNNAGSRTFSVILAEAIGRPNTARLPLMARRNAPQT